MRRIYGCEVRGEFFQGEEIKMEKRQLHLITVGNSIITNFQKKSATEAEIKYAKEDDKIWDKLIDDGVFLNRLYEFLKSAPGENSAEINSFERFLEQRNVKHTSCLIYLIGTKTTSNEIAKNTLERYFKEKGCELLTSKEVSGYFWESRHSDKMAIEEFTKGISDLLDRFLRVAMKKKEEGYEVVFNPTGGMKPHVITCALAGFMTASPVYYIHENFRDIVILPPLLYLPRGKELNVLSELKERVYSGAEYNKLRSANEEEVERLRIYGLVEIETDERTGKDYRIKLTERGKFVLGLYEV